MNDIFRKLKKDVDFSVQHNGAYTIKKNLLRILLTTPKSTESLIRQQTVVVTAEEKTYQKVT